VKKDASFWKLLILALIVGLGSSLLFRVIEGRDSHLKELPLTSLYPVKVFIEPTEGRTPVIEAIRSAKESIELMCYLFSDGIVIEELTEACRRGVRVRTILERKPYGDSPVNYQTKRVLESAGAHVKWANPEFALTHAKTMIVDGNKALIMSLNLCKSAFKKNREHGVIVEDPKIVAEIRRIFEADWRRQMYEPREPNLVVSPENSRRKTLMLITKAKNRIWLQQLILEDEKIKEALLEAAKRGIELKILLANPTRIERNLGVREYLKESGAEVRFMYRPHLHTKFIDVDGQVCFIGSQNLSSQSLDLNREIGILLTDKDSISRLEETFLIDWKRAR